MKFIYVIMLIVILAINSAGCAAPAANTPTENSISESSNTSNSNKKEEVIIQASYEKPLSIEKSNTILLDGLLEGDEYIEVIVNGEIFDFEQIELKWNEGTSVIEEKETVNRIEKLSNQTLVIKTMIPEGIPTEKIKWKSKSGNTYEYIIQENSLGDIDNKITKFEIK